MKVHETMEQAGTTEGRDAEADTDHDDDEVR
jgi:hypothetical protein